MKNTCTGLAFSAALLMSLSPRLEAQLSAAGDDPPAIQKVEIGSHREFRVNGEPFLPIMGWLQAPSNFPKLKGVGINTITGYHWNPGANTGAGDTKNSAEYGDLAKQAGLYFVSPFMRQHPDAMEKLKASDNLLAWIHDDEPDLPKSVTDAEVLAESDLIINSGSPLWRMLDGKPSKAAVLDPMEGAAFSVTLKKPVTVESFEISLTPALNQTVPKEIELLADGKEIARIDLENKKGPQKVALDRPASFSKLTVKVASTYSGEVKYGTIGEVAGLDASGTNVLLSPERKEPQKSTAQSMEEYKEMKAFDPSRPVLLTVTSFFINDPVMHGWYTKEESERMYPEYLKAADVPGFDVYPIYGWNRPDKLHWVSQGMRELRAYEGGTKPVFAWIEVQPGTEFGEKAHPVTGVEIRHEVYQAIINGATAIGYFTHQFKPNFTEFGVPPENQMALLELNRQLERLAPVILGQDVEVQPVVTFADGLETQWLAKEHDGAVYLFVQNMDIEKRSGDATVALDGLAAGTRIEVVDEERSLVAGGGTFTDSFEPLAVHIYKIDK